MTHWGASRHWAGTSAVLRLRLYVDSAILFARCGTHAQAEAAPSAARTHPAAGSFTRVRRLSRDVEGVVRAVARLEQSWNPEAIAARIASVVRTTAYVPFVGAASGFLPIPLRANQKVRAERMPAQARIVEDNYPVGEGNFRGLPAPIAGPDLPAARKPNVCSYHQ